ncbi:hypothetical protein P7K49_022274 [Saguinus oedipus]|uniref:Uncharacterized protein n=1 Tax=Saguinus oedipus TaxID=9490 RepID=A0ABQ9UVS0_SAGOE|nr:hypothetical protein P7K49_022274 [Saguinus oedipus]
MNYSSHVAMRAPFRWNSPKSPVCRDGCQNLHLGLSETVTEMLESPEKDDAGRAVFPPAFPQIAAAVGLWRRLNESGAKGPWEPW